MKGPSEIQAGAFRVEALGKLVPLISEPGAFRKPQNPRK